MNYTVKQISKIAGVSVRTLHYYDEINLLKPSFIRDNGYRYYGERELLKLQQILFFRELEFPLQEIMQMINASDFNSLDALVDQRKLLTMKKDRITKLITTIDKTIRRVKGGENMNNDDMFGSFTKDQMEEYKKEAKQRWGHTDAYKQSAQRTKNWTKADYERVAKEGAIWTQSLASLREKGFTSDSPEVQKMIAQHYEGLRTFYEPNYEMYRGLGQMYVDDARFAAYYEKFSEGLSVFMRDAMIYFVDEREAQSS